MPTIKASDLMRHSWLAVGLWAMACGPSSEVGDVEPQEIDPIFAYRQDIVDVEQTSVKRQAIGNCWIYATASWSESLALTADQGELNISESYWTYWHWYMQIVGQQPNKISTGGNFGTVSRIIRSYGLMHEGAFISEESAEEMSWHQSQAEFLINQSLSSGELSSQTRRRDRALVRKELNRAWGLAPEVAAELDRAFGEDGRATLSNGADLSGTQIVHPDSVTLQYSDQGQSVRRSLTASLSDWTEKYYPSSPQYQREVQQILQKALHHRVPAILTWFVDFNALHDGGKFEGVPENPGRQGFHMTVAEDYEIENVPGFGVLKAGELETRPEALEAALAVQAQLVKIRTKNSWGSFRDDREFVPGFPGYHDLYMSYLNGPVKQCRESNANDCPWEIVPLQSIIVPRSYLN